MSVAHHDLEDRLSVTPYSINAFLEEMGVIPAPEKEELAMQALKDLEQADKKHSLKKRAWRETIDFTALPVAACIYVLVAVGGTSFYLWIWDLLRP